MINKEIVSTIEHYLYIYQGIDKEIEELEQQKEDTEGKDINSWIKSNKVNRVVENKAIKNIRIDEKIEKYKKWKEVISNILKDYKKNDLERYTYIKMKYFKKYSINKIEMETSLTKSTQMRLKQDIIYYIAIFAYKEDLIFIRY